MKIGHREGEGDRGCGQTVQGWEPGAWGSAHRRGQGPESWRVSELLFLHLISEFGGERGLEPLLPQRTLLLLYNDIASTIAECTSPETVSGTQ